MCEEMHQKIMDERYDELAKAWPRLPRQIKETILILVWPFLPRDYERPPVTGRVER